MNNASTPEGRGQERPNDAEPFFPAEGTFHAVVPLSEVDRAPRAAALAPVDAADVGRPSEAAWAREAHRAGRAGWKEDEETLVPTRTRRAARERRSWVTAASVIVLSLAAGVASGTYLIWSSQRAPAASTPAVVAAEATSLPPAPAPAAAESPAPDALEGEAVAQVESTEEAAADESPREAAEAVRSSEAAPAPKQAPSPQPAPSPRAERVARAAAEARAVTPAPKPARVQSPAPPPRPRASAVAQQPARPPAAERALPISSPPPSAKSKKVIQWP